MAMTETPLCVGLDGSIVRTDLLYESLLLLIKRNPLYLFMALLWLLRGRAALKAEIAARIELNASALPYNQELLKWLRHEHARGRQIWLCSACNDRIASAIAAHLGIFDGVIASDSRINLAGQAKADRLVENFGYRAFNYCGNEWRDVAVWRCSNGAITADGGPRIAARSRLADPSAAELLLAAQSVCRCAACAAPASMGEECSPVHPLLAAHRLTDLDALLSTLLGFVVLLALRLIGVSAQ